MEFATLLFAGISAAMAAVQVWRETRDGRAAAEEFDRTFERARDAPETREAAEQLVRIAPLEVIEHLERRADRCWTGYRDVLGGDFLPDEVDRATVSVQSCVCRELSRIHDINGGEIPERWRDQWDAYACAELGRSAEMQA